MLKEIIQEMAGESKKSSNFEQKEKSKEVEYMKKLSGLQEDFSEDKKIYIHKPKDIEKFYSALAIELKDNVDALNTLKDVFKKIVY